MRNWDSGTVIAGGSSGWDPHKDDKYATKLKQDPVVVWQDRYYVPIVLSGLALTFVVGFVYGGWIEGLGCFLLAGVGRTSFSS